MSRIVIGIDPGKTGAVAICGARLPAFIQSNKTRIVIDCPTVMAKVNNKSKEVQDPGLMAMILRPYVGEDVHVYLEKVSAMKGQGVTSMFSFGTNYGTWLGIIAAFRFPYTLVTPQAWKKVMMSGMDRSDDSDRQRALQLFPEMSGELSRKKDDGRADALLICEYGVRQG